MLTVNQQLNVIGLVAEGHSGYLASFSVLEKWLMKRTFFRCILTLKFTTLELRVQRLYESNRLYGYALGQ